MFTSLYTTSLVLSIGDDFHVIWVDAMTHPTQVVDHHTLWDGAVSRLPGHPVSLLGLTPHLYDAIPLDIHVLIPQNAVITEHATPPH